MPRILCLSLLCALSLPLRAESLAVIFERAWQRSPQAALAAARQDTVQAG